MGDAQSVPVLGEAVTIVDSVAKITAAGACAAGGFLMEPVFSLTSNVPEEKLENPLLDGAVKLAKGAGNSWVEYTEKNLIAGSINMKVKRHYGDYEGERRIDQKVKNSLEGFVDSVPVVGHAKGVYHYMDGDTEHGNRCMLSATRGAAVLAAGAITGGVGGGAVLAGGIGVGTGVTYDATASIIDSNVHNEERFHGTISCVNQFIETRDPNALVDIGLAAAGDFVSAAGAQQIMKVKQLKNQKQSLNIAYKQTPKNVPEYMPVDPKIATQESIQAAQNMQKLVSDGVIKGDEHVSSLVKDIDTNQTFEGYNQRARADINENSCAKQGEASGFKLKTNAQKAAKRGPTTFQDQHPEVEPAPEPNRQQHACAEHQALSNLYEMGQDVDAKVRVFSVKCTNGCHHVVARCQNCMKYGELMGNVLTDLVEGSEVPVEKIAPYVVRGCGCGLIVAKSCKRRNSY